MRYVVLHGRLWDDLYIGFQNRISRDPDIYHHKYTDLISYKKHQGSVKNMKYHQIFASDHNRRHLHYLCAEL